VTAAETVVVRLGDIVAAADLIAECRAAGIELHAGHDTLHIRAKPGVLDPRLRDRLKACKRDVIRLVRSQCPTCARSLSEKAQCWKCDDRQCEGCGRLTGSALIANCVPCGNRLPDSKPYGE
jgi:hypothetical protein